MEHTENQDDEHICNNEGPIIEGGEDLVRSCSGDDSDDGSPVAISVAPQDSSMTFNSQVLVNVEEFIYCSVKLSIKFQLLNNNIVVGPYVEGAVPPPVVAMLDALRATADPPALARAQGTLQVAEALEKEADLASLHTLTREDLQSLRRQTSSDDTFCCRGLVTATCKNTLLTYPPKRVKPSAQRRPSLRA
eukprot:CAMPEP_0114439990 /NCGR_PEP_ID=MMETSP0103-20121206/15512_1 /TAXON_ID=37642 ORGANISM="Paraphysomonas imperforata, Strain PA2" /NCGR_SAMPLE_ID=MMETSP0103 /ASSEMBLY_ACC=CAM_ASM_000201 /LENGTH=190 /DNA_ID=CAMNT_0001610827 /DNA_START=106 /DNA_END=674 /DNA_ORIENTATION=+